MEKNPYLDMANYFKKCVLGVIVICLVLLSCVLISFNNRRKTPASFKNNIIASYNKVQQEKSTNNNTAARVALFDRRICSGLGDRLLAIFSAYTIAVLNNRSLVARWCEQSDRDDRIYPLATLQMHLRLPDGIKLLVDNDYDKLEISKNDALVKYEGQELEAFEGYDGVPSLAFRTMALDDSVSINRQLFENAYYNWTKQIKCDLPPNKSSGYLVLHIRQGDKTYEHGSHPFVPGIPNKQYCTHEAISHFTEKPIYVISDDYALKQKVVLSYPTIMIGSDGVYDDLCLMMNSQGIIQHSPVGWSALSAVAAFAAEIPLMSTWYGTSSNKYNPLFSRLYDFGAKGGRPKLTMDCTDLQM